MYKNEKKLEKRVSPIHFYFCEMKGNLKFCAKGFVQYFFRVMCIKIDFVSDPFSLDAIKITNVVNCVLVKRQILSTQADFFGHFVMTCHLYVAAY